MEEGAVTRNRLKRRNAAVGDELVFEAKKATLSHDEAALITKIAVLKDTITTLSSENRRLHNVVDRQFTLINKYEAAFKEYCVHLPIDTESD